MPRVLRADRDRRGWWPATRPSRPGWGVSRSGSPTSRWWRWRSRGDGRRALEGLEEYDGPRQRRVALTLLGGEPRFADVWLAREPGGAILLEAHPVDEFPGEDPAQALPLALSAALKGLAHELRNPLAGLRGAAQLLARRAGDGDWRELVELIAAEVQRLSQLVDRLLSPAPPRPHEPLNIHGVLEQVVRLAEQEAGWAVRLVRDYDPSLPPLPRSHRLPRRCGTWCATRSRPRSQRALHPGRVRRPHRRTGARAGAAHGDRRRRARGARVAGQQIFLPRCRAAPT